MSGFSIQEWNSKVGATVGWEVFCEVRSRRISREAYQDAFQAMFGYEPDVDSDIMAFGEAVRDVAKAGGCFEEKILEEDGRHVYRVCRSKKYKAEETVKFAVGFKVEWNDKTHELLFSEETHPMVQQIKDTFANYRVTVSDHKFRVNFKKVLQNNHSFNLRDTGGIYFLPNINSNDKVVKDLQELFQKFDNGKVYPIAFDDKEGSCVRELVRDASLNNITSILQKAKDECKDMNKKRICGLQTIIESLDSAANEGAGMGVLLGMEADFMDIIEEIHDTQNMYVDAMKRKEASK